MVRFKTWALSVAESFDAWRVVPRTMLIAYGYLVWNLYTWYRAIPTYVQRNCDGAVLEILLARNMKFEQARDLACNIVATVGGPTSEQTMFVTTIIGLSTGIFALYTTTGRKWQRESHSDMDYSGDAEEPLPDDNEHGNGGGNGGGGRRKRRW